MQTQEQGAAAGRHRSREQQHAQEQVAAAGRHRSRDQHADTGAGSSSMQQGAAACRHRSKEQQQAGTGAGSSSMQAQEQKLGLPEENGADVLKEI